MDLQSPTTLVKSALQTEPTPQTCKAGGSNPEHFDWKEAWYPIFFVKDLDKTRPSQFTALEKNLVIWWDKAGAAWRVFEDHCPHTLAPFSEGRITDQGLLECPFHGWAFSGDGNCEFIPQQSEGGCAHAAKRACAKTFPAVVEQGILFVYLGNPQNAGTVEVPLLDSFEEMDESWAVLETFRDLPYNIITLLENVLDPSHLCYTHHKSLGDRAEAGPIALELLSHEKSGFTGIWREALHVVQRDKQFDESPQHTKFIAPGLVHHNRASKGSRIGLTFYATPISQSRTRFFGRFAFKLPSKIAMSILKLTPSWFDHINLNKMLEDDQIMSCIKERTLEAKGGTPGYKRSYYLPMRSDTYMDALRDWVNKYHAEPFPHQKFSPIVESKAQLQERYYAHTENCSCCKKTLKNLKRGKGLALITAIFAWAAVTLLPIFVSLSTGLTLLLVVGVIASLSIWFGLTQLEKKFYKGLVIPPRNLS